MIKYARKFPLKPEVALEKGKLVCTGTVYADVGDGSTIYRFSETILVLSIPSVKRFNARVKYLLDSDYVFDFYPNDDGGDIHFMEKDLDALCRVKLGSQNFIKRPRKGRGKDLSKPENFVQSEDRVI